jgi:hypothetical protein
MSDIVNLRRVRKANARAAAADQAAENRARSGTTKAARAQSAVTQDLERRRLDGHHRERDSKGGDA